MAKTKEPVKENVKEEKKEEKKEKKVISLSIKDRIIIPNLFPQRGSMMDQLVSKDIQEKIEMSQEEREKADVKQMGERITWDKEFKEEVEVEFSGSELDFLKQKIKEKDNSKEVSFFDLETYLKLRDA